LLDVEFSQVGSAELDHPFVSPDRMCCPLKATSI